MENLWRSEDARWRPAPAATSAALPARVARQSQFQGEQQVLCMYRRPNDSTFRRTRTECADLRAKGVPSEVFLLRLESPLLQGSLVPRIPQLRDFRQRQRLPQGRLLKRYASSRARSSPENRRAFRNQPVEYDRVAKFLRSEERRVGKEGRSRWWLDHNSKKS